MTTRRRWILAAAGAATVAGVAVVGLFVAGLRAAQRFDPYIREQAIEYLKTRFDADVELSALKVRLPGVSPLRLLTTGGRGSVARAEAIGLVVRRRGSNAPPLFTLERCTFEVDLGSLWAEKKHVKSVRLAGMRIHIPPRNQAVKKAVH